MFGVKAEISNKFFCIHTNLLWTDFILVSMDKNTVSTEVLKVGYSGIITNCLEIDCFCVDFFSCIFSLNNLALVRIFLILSSVEESHLILQQLAENYHLSLTIYALWFKENVGRGAAGPDECPQSNLALREQCCLTCKACSRMSTPVVP